MLNRGAVRLAEEREKRQLRQVDVARLLGCSQPTVSALESGELLPSLAVSLKAERELGIDPSDWLKVVRVRRSASA